jgi:carboxyl-terminal processing protease
MNRRLALSRPISLFLVLASTFALGVLTERSGRFFTPYYYTPAGLEKTFAPFWETWGLIDKHYVNREVVNSERMTRAAIAGLIVSLGDPGHTSYLTPEDRQRLESGLKGELEGIGARLSMRRRLPTIVNTFPGSPARSGGLRPGDVVLEVDGKAVTGMSLDQVVNLIRGPAATVVRLRVTRNGQAKPLDLSFARAKVEVPDVSWALLRGVPVAHVAIVNFGMQAHAQLKAALEESRRKGARALILDVRGNPGGLKDQAVAISSEFLKEGNVFLEQDAKGNRTAAPVLPGATAPDIPLVVLIDEGSASSSEILAGAMQDHGRGKLIGARTYGAGTLLREFLLTDGSAVLLAVAEWLTPNGRQIWHNGISPDIEVTLPATASILTPETDAGLNADSLAKSEDKQLLKGLEALEGQLK